MTSIPKPRLLYLGHNLPFPPHEGALIRSYHTVRLLSRAFDVTGVYFFRRGAHATDEARGAAVEEMGRFGSATAHPIPQEFSRWRTVWDHARSVMMGMPYTRWVHESRSVRERIEDELRGVGFDLVHVDSLDLLAYLPTFFGTATVLAHHNVESSLLRRRAEPEPALRKAYIRYQANLVESAEREWCRRVALNVAVSDQDAQALRRIAPESELFVMPNGVDTTEFTPTEEEPHGDIVFVGGYSWFPNTDGMEFFAQQVLPLIRAEEPNVAVRWVGKAPDEARTRFAELGVEMTGYVDDIRPEVLGSRVVVVPLRVGGGTRLKILDAWAMGKAVVSTSVGCEGLRTRHGENILIADTPAEFAQATLRVLRIPTLRRRLGAEARRTAEQHYDWDSLGDGMCARYLGLL